MITFTNLHLLKAMILRFNLSTLGLHISAMYLQFSTFQKYLDMIFLPSLSSELATHFGMPFLSNKGEEYKMKYAAIL